MVGGRYIRDESADDTIVSVARPIDDFITGGGHLVLGDSEGTYAGDDGSKSNFGFNVKFNPAGTNLQGRATILVRGDGKVYKIKTNSLTSLGTVDVDGSGTGIAEFEAKANLTDVTDAENPISLGGQPDAADAHDRPG